MAYLANGYKNYSRFYRDHDTFDYMGNHLLYNLAKRKAAEPDSQIDVWCCGCAGGEEVYTVQMLWQHDLAPYFPGVRLDMYATDIDASAIATAKEAEYTAHAVVEMPAEWLDTYFQVRGDAVRQEAVPDAVAPPQESREAEGPDAAGAADDPQNAAADALQPEPKRPAREAKDKQRPGAKGEGAVYKVLPELAAQVRFETQDAEKGVPDATFDVILARYSVFLYCSNAVAWAILQQMVFRCLRVGGYLVIGGKDNLPSQWASLPLQKCTASIGFGHGIHIYQRVHGRDAPLPPPAAAPLAGAAAILDPPASPQSGCCGRRMECTGTCGYDTLEAYLAACHNRPHKYSMSRRRLVFQLSDTHAAYDEERARLNPEELQEFLGRMARVAEDTRSRLRQLQLAQVQEQELELAKFRVPALTAEGLANFLDKMQSYEAQARERQEKLEKELTGTQKRKKLTRKKMRKFLARMSAAAERRRSREEPPEARPPPSAKPRLSFHKRLPAAAAPPLAGDDTGTLPASLLSFDGPLDGAASSDSPPASGRSVPSSGTLTSCGSPTTASALHPFPSAASVASSEAHAVATPTEQGPAPLSVPSRPSSGIAPPFRRRGSRPTSAPVSEAGGQAAGGDPAWKPSQFAAHVQRQRSGFGTLSRGGLRGLRRPQPLPPMPHPKQRADACVEALGPPPPLLAAGTSLLQQRLLHAQREFSGPAGLLACGMKAPLGSIRPLLKTGPGLGNGALVPEPPLCGKLQ